MRLTARLMMIVTAVVLCVALFAGVALARNTDTHNEWWNGLGDGHDNDNYVHPFNDNRNNHNHNSYVGLWHRSCSTGNYTFKNSKEVVSQHNHFNWYPDRVNDRGLYTINEAQPGGADGHAKMSAHFHLHHDPC